MNDVGRHGMWCLLAIQFGAYIGFFPPAQDNQAAHIEWSKRPPDLTHMSLGDLEKRLSDLKSTEGRTHPDLIPVLLRIAKVYLEQGAFVVGIPLAQQALDIVRKVHGENTPEAVLSLDTLGTLEHLAGDNPAAIKNFELALAIVEKYLGTPRPMQALLLLHLGTAYLADGSLAQAEHALKRAKRVLVRAFGRGTVEATAAEKELGTLYLRLRENTKAEKELEEAFATRAEWLSRIPDDMSEADVRIYMAQVQVPLGALYTSVGRYEEANHWLLGALQAYEEILGRNRPELEEVLVNLAALAAAQGDLKSASSYQNRAESIHDRGSGLSHLNAVPLSQPIKPLVAQKTKR